MASQLVNELCCFKHCPGVYELNGIVDFCRCRWTVERAIIASNKGWQCCQEKGRDVRCALDTVITFLRALRVLCSLFVRNLA